MRTLPDAGLDVVFLALFGASAVAILMVCLLGLVSLSKDWEGDILGELSPFRAGNGYKMSRETKPLVGVQMRWQSLSGALLRD